MLTDPGTSVVRDRDGEQSIVSGTNHSNLPWETRER